MTDRAYIVSRTLETKIAMAENNGNNALIVTLDVLKDILSLLKEQEKIKEQFIEAFNTIRDAYRIPANREKILLNYLLKNACCCADEKAGEME